MNGAIRLACVAAIAVVSAGSRSEAAPEYPFMVVLAATANNGTTNVTSNVTVRVDRLMEENRRKRVMDALKFSGYGNFLTALRALPVIGGIEIGPRMVPVRYAIEQAEGTTRRLVLVADRPLFFLGAATTPRAGYELTVLSLRIDGQGGIAGEMAGAARVKPVPDGIVLDDFAEVPVQLTGRVTRP